MGGTVAGQTTDAVSAAFAEYVNADLLVYATSVPGVFDADPNADEEATKFDDLSASDLVSLVVDLEMDAGSNAPVDLLAAKIIQRSGIRAIVLDGSDPERVGRAIRSGEHDGTDVVPADANGPPTDWSER
jgi:uridylate kinase